MKILLLLLLSTSLIAKPTVTIITSVYKGDRYLTHYLKQISRQTIYKDCQHILINANSPGNEEETILNFQKTHPNVEYLRLENDPGLYGVWNIAIKRAKSDLLVNVNLDDRLAPFALETLSNILIKNPDFDLVYSNCYATNTYNQRFERFRKIPNVIIPDHNHKDLVRWCYLGSHPVWRKSMHDKYGLFDDRFFCAGDWEMWLRASSHGAKFFHLDQYTSINYLHKRNLSMRPSLAAKRAWEFTQIKAMYTHLDSRARV